MTKDIDKTMSRVPVSVVIPTYNRGDMIADAIDSVLAQTLAPAQIIIIDDGSTDDTARRLARYDGRVVYRRQDNAGVSAARNHGVRVSSEPLVAFLDADDVWHPRKLELQVREMEREPELGMLATDNFDWPVAAFPPAPEDAGRLVRSVTWEQLVVRTMILTSSVLARRTVLDRVGEFDTALLASEDRDLFLRIAKVARIAMLKLPLIGYRDSPGSLTKQAQACERGMRLILRRLDERGEWGGRRLLRRKAYSFMHYRCSTAQACAGNHGGAVLRAAKSMIAYPLPYGRDEVRMPLDRPKRLVVNLLRLMRLKRPDPGPAANRVPATDALRSLRSANFDRSTPSPLSAM